MDLRKRSEANELTVRKGLENLSQGSEPFEGIRETETEGRTVRVFFAFSQPGSPDPPAGGGLSGCLGFLCCPQAKQKPLQADQKTRTV